MNKLRSLRVIIRAAFVLTSLALFTFAILGLVNHESIDGPFYRAALVAIAVNIVLLLCLRISIRSGPE